MGTKYVLHFDNEKFFRFNKYCKVEYLLRFTTRLNILCTFSYLNLVNSYQEVGQAKIIYKSILDQEKINGMPIDVIDKAIKNSIKGKKI